MAAMILLIALLAALIARHWYRKRRYDGLPQPSGAWPLAGHLPALVANETRDTNATTRLLQIVDDMCDTLRDDGLFYVNGGPFFDYVIVHGAQQLEQILSLPGALQHQGLMAHYARDLFAGGGVLVSNGAANAHARRHLLQFVRAKQWPMFERVIAKHASLLCDAISAQNGEVSDVMQTLAKVTLSVTIDINFGDCSGAQALKSSAAFCRHFHTAHELLAKSLCNPLAHYHAVYKRSAEGAQFYEAIDNLHRVFDTLIAQRKERFSRGATPPPDKTYDSLLDMLMQLHMDGQMSELEVKQQLITMFFVAFDTSNATVAFTLFSLANEPHVQQRARDEISEKLGDATASSDSVRKLSYMDMVLNEAQRMFHAVPCIFRELQQDLQLGAYTIPAGTQLLLYYRSMHRDPHHWPRPEQFDPERFSPEMVASRSKYAFLSFGHGARNCIGQRFAKLYAKMTIAALLRNFRLLPVTKFGEVDFLLTPQLGTVQPIAIKFAPI